MYRILKDGNQLALLDNPRFVKLQTNGYFILCEEKDAQGIVIDNIIYSIDDRLEGHQSVSYEKVDIGDLIQHLETMQSETDELTIDHEYRLVLLELDLGGET